MLIGFELINNIINGLFCIISEFVHSGYITSFCDRSDNKSNNIFQVSSVILISIDKILRFFIIINEWFYPFIFKKHQASAVK